MHRPPPPFLSGKIGEGEVGSVHRLTIFILHNFNLVLWSFPGVVFSKNQVLGEQGEGATHPTFLPLPGWKLHPEDWDESRQVAQKDYTRFIPFWNSIFETRLAIYTKVIWHLTWHTCCMSLISCRRLSSLLLVCCSPRRRLVWRSLIYWKNNNKINQ